MALETGTYINSLDAANPATTDGLSQADDHLRLLKSTIKNTFPNVDGAMTATEVELNVLDGVTVTTSELNTLDGFTGAVADLNYAKDLRATGVTDTEFNKLDGLTATTSELNTLDGLTATTTELNTLDGLTATTTELNTLDGLTATTAELNTLDGLTASTTELNTLDGLTASTTELNYVDGVTSAIQTQLNSKAPLASPALTGTPTAPTASVSTDSTQVATTAFVRNIVPTGVILLWSGAASAIPSGYVLCDGSNSTPDLRGRFIIGAHGDSDSDANTYDVGDTGGSATHTLTTAEIPQHTHTATSTVTDPGHSHVLPYGDSGGESDGWDGNGNTSTTNSATTGITVATTIAMAGGGFPHENRPPYYALCYIMKT